MRRERWCCGRWSTVGQSQEASVASEKSPSWRASSSSPLTDSNRRTLRRTGAVPHAARLRDRGPSDQLSSSTDSSTTHQPTPGSTRWRTPANRPHQMGVPKQRPSKTRNLLQFPLAHVKLAVSSGVLSVGHGPEQGALCHRADEAPAEQSHLVRSRTDGLGRSQAPLEGRKRRARARDIPASSRRRASHLAARRLR